jgi:CheY-like chemotaxis protein
MTSGSAACLSGTMPQAPLSLFRTPDLRVVPHEFGNTAPSNALLHKDAGDPPGPHILVVEDNAVAALAVQRMLRECGYRVVGPAASSAEVERLMDRNRQPFVCGLLAACVPGAAAIADNLMLRGVPVVWLASETSDAFSWDRRDEPVLRQSFDPQELREAIQRAVRHIGSRRLYAVPPPQTVWPRVFPQL